jgi:selenide,water dikinase
VTVGETLQSTSHPSVFAAGDVATMVGHPRPRSGVYAVRQGPPLAHNLRAAMTGESLVRYVPQRRALAIITTGGRYAVATRGDWAIAGGWVWRWKDGIDRRFMARYASMSD